MSKRILIVEDEVDVARALAEVLEAAGYETVSALNGLEALAQLREGHRPDLILLDMSMPVLDGRGFRLEQQRMKEAAEIPVVVVTADGEARRKAFSIRAQGHIHKPCSIRALLDVVERHCGPPGDGAAGVSRASGA